MKELTQETALVFFMTKMVEVALRHEVAIGRLRGNSDEAIIANAKTNVTDLFLPIMGAYDEWTSEDLNALTTELDNRTRWFVAQSGSVPR